MDYEGEWGGGGPGHSWALKWHEKIFFHTSLLLLFLDPGSGVAKNQDPGSGINIPDLQHWNKLSR
jgi:hypothetical protein